MGVVAGKSGTWLARVSMSEHGRSGGFPATQWPFRTITNLNNLVNLIVR